MVEKKDVLKYLDNNPNYLKQSGVYFVSDKMILDAYKKIMEEKTRKQI